MNVIDIIQEEISEFNTTKFNPVTDLDVLRRFWERRFSDAANNSHLKEFTGKSGRKYIIKKRINYDVFHVYDIDAVKDQSRQDYLKPVGFVTFDVQNDYFTGY